MTDLDPRIAARLTRARLHTPADVRAYLERFPNGGEAIGRVDLQTVLDWLAGAESQDAAP